MPRAATQLKSSARTRTLPTGTVTFLFTDIEGSTLRWEAHGREMGAALERHNAIMDSAVAAHAGIVFKKLGDGCCAVFDRAKNAVDAALEAQRRLAQEDFSAVSGVRVRMAVHTGETEERDGDYFGPAVNRVARLMGLAQGGQVLLTSVTADMVERHLGAHVSVRELGYFTLRDVAAPERVFQLCAPELRDEFALSPLSQPSRNNLPTQLTRLVGRDEEVAALMACVQNNRLVTIAGSGGIGKTRIAVCVGSQMLQTFPDGVWLVELAPITVDQFVPNAVAAALGIHESPDRSLNASIAAALSARSTLLIFDNCEHLIEAVAEFCRELLRASNGLHVLATSRQALGLAGEQVYRVPPLTYPPRGSAVTAQDALQYSAVALFAERAAAVRQNFVLTQETAPIVGDICRRLDGIALAIELAAARIGVLSVARLSDGLTERFRLLTRGSRDDLPHHQTLRALIDWSYNSLDEREKALFRHVGVFAGGFSWDAAAATCGQNCGDALEVLDLLASLAAKSLVVAHTEGSHERYDLLESSREYALEKLAENGERQLAARKHAEFFRDFAQKGDQETAMPQYQWFAQLAREHENVRAALLWALDARNDPVLGGTIAGSLERFWFDAGHLGEGLYWIECGLAALDEALEPGVAARLHLARAVLLQAAKKLEAAERACELYEAVSDRRGLGYALRQRALALRRARRWTAAETAARRAATLLQEAGDVSGFAVASNTLGSIVAGSGQIEDARAIHRQALDAALSHGGEYAIGQTHAYLADLEFQCGDYKGAVRHALEALLPSQNAGAARLAANLRCNLAIYRIAQGERAQGADDAVAAIGMLAGTQDSYQTAIALQHVALAQALEGDARLAARLCAYVDAYFDSSAVEREATEAWGRQSIERELAAKLTPSERDACASEGAAWSEQRAVQEALGTRPARA